MQQHGITAAEALGKILAKAELIDIETGEWEHILSPQEAAALVKEQMLKIIQDEVEQVLRR